MFGNKISVLSCVYQFDNPVYFNQALYSALDQTLPPYEFVIVQDGPVPVEIFDVIQGFIANAHKYSTVVKHIVLDKNLGHGLARMYGVINCSCEYIAIIDADDINIRNRFYLQMQAFEANENIAVVGGNIVEIDSISNNVIAAKKMVPGLVSKTYIGTRCPLNQMTVMCKKSAILSVGNYIDFYNNEDYHLWIRLFLAKYKLYNMNTYLVQARVTPGFYKRRGSLKYFISEYKIQSILFRCGINSFAKFSIGVFIRFNVQVLLPSFIRAFLFKNFFRGQP